MPTLAELKQQAETAGSSSFMKSPQDDPASPSASTPPPSRPLVRCRPCAIARRNMDVIVAQVSGNAGSNPWSHGPATGGAPSATRTAPRKSSIRTCGPRCQLHARP